MQKVKIENVALVYVELPNANTEQDLFELNELINTAQGEVKLFCTQKRNSLDANTVVGSGKLEEIKGCIDALGEEIDVVVFSCELNATQRITLRKKLDCDVIDKIDLILDIFALRATSAEGKKQVELAQLTYNLATKPEGNFSRQGGGIGTRGPGETKLETNKRFARERMYRLRQELNEIALHRQVTRKQRKENDSFVVALVGYTNAGKSTLFNAITKSQVYADNKLFATLDTTVRKLPLPSGILALVCDTVGFINNLPHALLDAFKSTLNEATDADLLLNVCDISDENVANHIAVTEETLSQLHTTAPIVRVFNKCDKTQNLQDVKIGLAQRCVFVSAKTGLNVDTLLEVIEDYANKQYATVTLSLEHNDCAKILSKLHKYNAICKVKYHDDVAIITATIRRKYVNMFAEYISF